MKRTLATLAVVSICSLVSQNAMAQSHLGLNAVGVTAGIVSPENSDATVGFGVMANHGTLAPNIRLVSHMDFWSHSADVPFTGGSVSVNDMNLGARAEYMFQTKSSKLYPFAGGGLGLHFLHAKVETPGFPDMTDSSTKLGLDLGGGFTTPVSPKADFRSELWYGIVSDYSQWSLKAGLEFKL